MDHHIGRQLNKFGQHKKESILKYYKALERESDLTYQCRKASALVAWAWFELYNFTILKRKVFQAKCGSTL